MCDSHEFDPPCPSIYPSVLYASLFCSRLWGTWDYPRVHWVRGRVHPGLVASLWEGWHTDKLIEDFIHTCRPVHLTCASAEVGTHQTTCRKPAHRAHEEIMEQTPHREVPVVPVAFSLWGDSATVLPRIHCVCFGNRSRLIHLLVHQYMAQLVQFSHLQHSCVTSWSYSICIPMCVKSIEIQNGIWSQKWTLYECVCCSLCLSLWYTSVDFGHIGIWVYICVLYNGCISV